MTNPQRDRLESWRVQSPETPGWHAVITPQVHECRHAHIFRLNLPAGHRHTVDEKELELNLVLIHGTARVSGGVEGEFSRFDSIYIPGGTRLEIEAIEECVFYIGGAVEEGCGEVYVQHFDPHLPLGDIHQIHGVGTGQREVIFTLPPQVPASRLICGLTWSNQGGWTSWPPHQHSADLEEVYCYFDMPFPKIGFHVSYLESGKIDEGVVHPVHSGTCVGVPEGYHPTVASPGTVNAYMWVLAAVRPESRSYDLAIEDPQFVNLRGQ